MNIFKIKLKEVFYKLENKGIIIMKKISELDDILLITSFDIGQILKISTTIWKDEGLYPISQIHSVIKDNLSYSIKIQGEIISFCLVERKKKKNEANIFLIAVKDNYRNKGLGYRILNYCIKNAKKEGINNFFLHVSANNEIAINLYKKFGFEIIKIIDNYYHSKIYPEINKAYLMNLIYN